MLDFIIRNCRIIDGTGVPWYRADVGVSAGKIAAIGDLSALHGKEEYDAHDHFVAPGFIDIHTHSDATLWKYPQSESRILQGVTTEIGGNCGKSTFPVEADFFSYLQTYMGDDIPFTWTNTKGFLDYLEAERTSTNFGCLTGHGSLRIAVKGYSPEKLTAQEMGRMKDLAAQSLCEGAFGITSGLIYPPGCYSDTDEMIGLLGALHECGGFYATHMRNEWAQVTDSVRESILVARTADVPLQISHHKCLCRELWGSAVKETTAMIEQARAEGVDVSCDQYPYNASSTVLSANLPNWVLEGGYEAFAERIHTPDVREKLIDQVEASHVGRWQNIHVASVSKESNLWMLGQDIVELSKQCGKGCAEFLIDLIEDEHEGVYEVDFGMSEEDIEYIMRKPYVTIASDGWAFSLDMNGQPHPRSFGTFTRVLAHYSRDRKLFGIETAVQKMTSMPAARIGLRDRGLIREGMWADLVQFDLQTLESTPDYRAPKCPSRGIERVFVNGVLTAENGRHLGARAGKILRSH